MKATRSLAVAFLSVLPALGFAQGTPTDSPFSLSITPAASIPLPGSSGLFDTGSTVQIEAQARLSALVLDGELGLGSLALKTSSSVSVLSAGAGAGVQFGLGPWVHVGLKASGGYAWSYLADTNIASGGGSPYLYGGAGVDVLMSPEIGVGFQLGYRNYLGLYEGFEAGLSARALLGGQDWTSSVAAGATASAPLSLEVTPSVSIPVSASGSPYSIGSNLGLSAQLNALPFLSIGGELGYGSLPLKTGSSVTVLSGGLGVSGHFALSNWLSLAAQGSAGYAYGYIANSGFSTGGGSPYLYGGGGVDISVTQDVSVGFRAGYRDVIGLYQGVEASVGARVSLGAQGWSQRVETSSSVRPLSLEVTPLASVPLGDSSAKFQTGGSVGISTTFSLPFLPIAFLGADLGYGGLPLKTASSVSLLSGGVAVGLELGLAPWLSVNVRGSGGYYYGYLADAGAASGGGNPYYYGGAGLSLTVTPGLSFGLEVGYRGYVGLYQGLEAALSTRVVMGGAAWTAAGGAENLPQRPSPLVDSNAPLTAKPGTGLQFSKVNFQDVYPVFYKFYDDHSIGSASLHNFEKVAIQDVKLSVFVKEYMDNPKEVALSKAVDPGSDINVDLYGLFKKDILANTEDTKVSANINLTYTLGGRSYTASLIQTLNVLKRNALTWDDDRKAAAFASPNDPTALKFAKNVAAAVNGKGNTAIDQNLRLAAAIHDALTLYGITYTADPVATLNSDNKTVDYIQFPEQTLDYRSGKCSDFSALYASMYEALGIETAFITIPGHIYVAVALSMSADEARAVLVNKDDVIIIGDKVWLPIEVTLRTGGFMKAWQLGAKEWRENLAAKQAVLYPLHDAWKTYQAVGYSSGTTPVAIPADDKIALALGGDLSAFVNTEMGQQEVALLAAVSKANTTTAKDKALNSLAVLHSRFGMYDQAIKEFEQVLSKEEYVPSLINEGNIYFMQGKNDKALAYYDRALAKAPKSGVVLLAVARVNNALENYTVAQKAYSDLQQVDPRLASQFAFLKMNGDESTRAADASGTNGSVIWQDSP